MSSLPKDIRNQIKERLWNKADELDWRGLSQDDRASWYESWSKDKEVGGVLGHFMDPRKVRVYIKDTLLKPYLRFRLEEEAGRVLTVLSVDADAEFISEFIKPHGRLLRDGRVVCWGNSRDWKAVVISVFERAYQASMGEPFAAVLIETGQTADNDVRRLIQCVAERLGIERLVWMD